MKYLIVLLLIVTSCSTSKTKLDSRGKEVEVLSTKPGSGCSVVNKVVGENDNGSVDLARNHARNLAGKAGGNAITFDEEIMNGQKWRVHATAYECK